MNLLQNNVNVFHLTSPTLPCEIWNAHHTGATTALSEKETPEFIPPQLWPPNSPDLNPVDYSMWGLLQQKVYKIRITDLDELKQRLRWSGPSWIALSLWQPFVSGVIDSSRSVLHILYTFSCNISNTLLSSGFKAGKFGGHSWGGTNAGVSFCNNSMVARVWWAFQVSQGS